MPSETPDELLLRIVYLVGASIVGTAVGTIAASAALGFKEFLFALIIGPFAGLIPGVPASIVIALNRALPLRVAAFGAGVVSAIFSAATVISVVRGVGVGGV